MVKSLFRLLLLAVLFARLPAARCQDAAAPAAEAEQAGDEDIEEPSAEEQAPAKISRRKRAKAPAEAPNVSMADIAKVYKSQIAFGGVENELWKEFWTKLRDERGLFELRLAKQREGFIESLRSLDPKDHGQGLLDFETMQGNAMNSFEENQDRKIKDFIAERLAKLKEFGEIQETQRAQLAEASLKAWGEQRAALGITLPPPPAPKEKAKKGGKKKS